MAPQQSPTGIRQEKDQVIWSALSGDANSLQKESPQRPAKDGVEDTLSIEDFSGVVRKGNPDGWGIAEYPSNSRYAPPVILKNALPAYSDAHFPQAVSQAVSQSPDILLAHVRQASPEFKQIQANNAHPFTFGNWSFVHNGSVSGALSPAVNAKIDQYKGILGGGPKGDTDSERAFYYFLARLYEMTGTVDSTRISPTTKQTVFAQSIRELINYSHPTFKPITNDVLGVGGHILIQPACNFIVSDGQQLMAFKKVMDLFLGEKTLANKQKMYMVASEKMMNHDPSVKWAAVPEDHLVTMAWDPAGNPHVSLEPLLELTKTQTK